MPGLSHRNSGYKVPHSSIVADRRVSQVLRHGGGPTTYLLNILEAVCLREQGVSGAVSPQLSLSGL